MTALFGKWRVAKPLQNACLVEPAIVFELVGIELHVTSQIHCSVEKYLKGVCCCWLCNISVNQHHNYIAVLKTSVTLLPSALYCNLAFELSSNE
jgi:hypothetical protein